MVPDLVVSPCEPKGWGLTWSSRGCGRVARGVRARRDPEVLRDIGRRFGGRFPSTPTSRSRDQLPSVMRFASCRFVREWLRRSPDLVTSKVPGVRMTPDEQWMERCLELTHQAGARGEVPVGD